MGDYVSISLAHVKLDFTTWAFEIDIKKKKPILDKEAHYYYQANVLG